MESNNVVMHGTCHVCLSGPDGAVKQEDTYHNLITDAGDLYYASMAIAAVQPANAAGPTKVSGMKLGTGATTAAKNGSGAAIASYITGSGQAFDSGYPRTTNLGGGSGVEAVYQVTYLPGTATNSAIAEVAIVNDATTNNSNGSSASATIARVVFTNAYNKESLDTLAISWTHLFLGS